MTGKIKGLGAIPYKKQVENFWPGWRHRWIHFASSHSLKRTRNLKIKNNQNCQKIELYGSPTTES